MVRGHVADVVLVPGGREDPHAVAPDEQRHQREEEVHEAGRERVDDPVGHPTAEDDRQQREEDEPAVPSYLIGM